MVVRNQRAPRPIVVADEDAESRRDSLDALAHAGYETLEASSGVDALQAAREESAALVILEIRLPGLSGYEVCHQLRQELGSDVAIMFLTGRGRSRLDRVAGLLIGADDFLLKPCAPEELRARVHGLIRRGAAGPPRGEGDPRALTPREHEILRLLAAGLAQREIAGELVISPKTVGSHIEHILRKLEVNSRAQAVARAYRDSLLSAAANVPLG